MKKSKKLFKTGCIAICTSMLVSCAVKLDLPTPTAQGTKNTETTTQATKSTETIAQTTTTSPTETEDTVAKNIKKQLQTITNHKENWLETTFTCSYAVTDLNQDGQLEIIVSACQGTGLYTTSRIYETKKEAEELIQYERILDEFISEADIIESSVVAYYDAASQIYHYIFHDAMKNGAAEYYENIRDWSLQDGKIVENFLAYFSSIYTEGTAVITYTNAEEGDKQKEITEEEYQQMAETVFSDLEKKQVTINWIMKSPEEIEAMSEQEIINMLEESWNGFHIE